MESKISAFELYCHVWKLSVITELMHLLQHIGTLALHYDQMKVKTIKLMHLKMYLRTY
jgi:hypothetical protein